MSLTPWGYAAVMASGLAVGTAIGIAAGRWMAGGRAVDVQLLAIAGVCWLAFLVVGRLIAPAALRSTRQHQQWRDERRQPGMRKSAGL